MTVPDRSPPPLTLRLFGPFEVHVNGDPLPRLRSRKGQWLLALLALRHGAPVERAWLAGTLWPDSPEPQALASLRISLADLRHALGREAARLRAPTTQTLCLDLAGVEVDVVAFDAAVARTGAAATQLRCGPGEVVLASLERAIGLYRGPLLEGCAEEWVFQERQAREQAYLQALERLASDLMAGGEPAAAERHLRLAVAMDPLRESAQRALMQALAAGGSYAAAIHAYRDLRLRLHQELNVEPDAETTALFQPLRTEARGKATSGVQAFRRSGVREGRAVPAERLNAGSEATLTFLFTDIERSVQHWEEDPEAMRAALARHDLLLRCSIEANGGRVFKTVGDEFCAAFATAAEAVLAALTAQRALLAEEWGRYFRRRELILHADEERRQEWRPETAYPREASVTDGDPPRVRMALHTGAAEERDGDYFGPPVNRVARLLEAGHGGQILLSRATQELARDKLPEGVTLRDLGERRLKDLVRPERIFQLVSPDLPTEFPPPRTLDVRPNNLPAQPTPLLGRAREVAAAREWLKRGELRLLTLTGPGGTGKTHLALQVAADLVDAFPDGVFFVKLAPIRDPDRVAAAIAQPLGVRETGDRPLLEMLKEFLRAKELLLLLDNVEQVLTAAPLVAELLAVSPRLKVLVTSRAVLHLHGEQEFPVPLLAVPDPKHLPSLERLFQYAAVELFIQRAVNVQPEFRLTDANAPAVVKICHRLDGLPLAIELAAARIKLFPPQALLDRMESRLKLLTGGARDLPARHQTLRGAIAWSYDLLTDEEQRLFRRLSVFVGGCTLEAAAAVSDAERGTADQEHTLAFDLLDGVASLVDKSLLRREEQGEGEPRFGMLETIREYGLERLAESGEEPTLRQRHANYFVGLAERAEPTVALGGPEERGWLERLEAEHDNLRAALDWAVAAEQREEGLRLAGALQPFWQRHGYMEEGRWRLAAVLERADRSERTTALAKALRAAGWHAFHQNDFPKFGLLEESLTIERQLGDKHGIAASLFYLGAREPWTGGSLERARQLLEESVKIYRELGDKARIAECLQNLGQAQSDPVVARDLLSESLAMHRELGNNLLIGWTLWALGNLDRKRGEPETALRSYREGLTLFRELNYKYGVALMVDFMGGIALAHRDWEAAVSWLAEAQALYGELGKKWVRMDTLLGAASAAYHQEQFERAAGFYREALTLSQEIGDKPRVARSLEGLAGVAGAQGQPERGARLFGAAEAVRDAISSWIEAADRPQYDRDVAAVRSQLSEEAFAAAWAAGRALSLEEAVSFALEPDSTSPTEGE